MSGETLGWIAVSIAANCAAPGTTREGDGENGVGGRATTSAQIARNLPATASANSAPSVEDDLMRPKSFFVSSSSSSAFLVPVKVRQDFSNRNQVQVCDLGVVLGRSP